MHHNRYNL